MFPLLLIAAAQPAGHDALNPLYHDLRTTGVLIGPDLRAKLPPPVVADGLDAAAQKAAITALDAGDHSWAEFTRDSPVAPQVVRIADVTPSDPAAPARRLTVGFVAHGDFDATDDEKFLDRLLNGGRGDGAGKPVAAADLAKRNITPGERERFGHVGFDVLERVKLSVTGRAVWSKTGESVLAAAAIDPRFVGDADFPDQWQSLTKPNGKEKLGPAQPYTGAGLYLKVTKLAAPAGALFVEQHVVFAEPKGWFDGANLLRSKLTPVVQSNVRSMRREWKKAGGK
jgi:hypothetical protein